MNAVLQRVTSDPTWGALVIDGALCCFTLEPPKNKRIPAGLYSCVRVFDRRTTGGMFIETTFEIVVPGHTGVLFHIGNYVRDTSGCVLTGAGFFTNIKEPMLSHSTECFKRFLEVTKAVSLFHIDILDERP